MAQRVVCVVGPTASGKTKMGVALAKRFNGEVVSVDSMQIYRGMEIGTAAPTPEEMAGVPHHMIGVANPAESWSVSRFTQEADRCIQDILRRGRLPVLVGGTGLYLDALVRGQTFAAGQQGGAVRLTLQQRLAREGAAALLEELGAQVTVEVITPWRFDVARNHSLDLVPEDADICVCTDLDEVFQPGWRAEVEKAWLPGTDRLLYHYTWNFLPDGREGLTFWYDKIHRRHGCRWVNPVHEILQYDGGAPQAQYAEGVRLEHHPDQNKSRGQYLALLELAVEEDPTNDRNVHYLGREYFFRRRWEESIATLKTHLSLPTATWADERCASMRLLAKDYGAMAMEGEQERWLLRAVGEAPHLREPWLDLADLYYRRRDWHGVLWTTEHALTITTRPRTYMSEATSWGEHPWDLASLGYYYTGQYDKAWEAVQKAAQLAPNNPPNPG